MVLQLDPRVPVVWRTPDSVQLGVDRPLLVISGMTPARERVLNALRGGVPRAGAVMLGREAGATDADIDGLLRQLEPALLPDRRSAPCTGAVCIDGAGRASDLIRDLMEDLGIPVLDAPAAPDGDPRPSETAARSAALAIIVAHYVVDPRRHGWWLRRDIPHLPVVFSDTEVSLGPVVEPGTTACLGCLHLARADADPAWPAMAAQLVSRRAPTETPLLGVEAAARVARLALERLRRGTAAVDSVSFVIDAETGQVRRREHRPHARCGCRSLTENENARGAHAVGLPTPTS